MTYRLPPASFFLLRLALPVITVLLGATLVHGAPEPRMLGVAWNDTSTRTGLLSRINTVSPWEFQGPAITIAKHSALRSAGGRVFAISNTHSEISIVSSDTWTVERVITFREGGRPIDVAVVNADTAYITRDESSKLLKLDLTDGSTQEVVDLSIFADLDGNPDLGWMVVHEGRLFVQIRRINLWAFVPPATIAVIDLAQFATEFDREDMFAL